MLSPSQHKAGGTLTAARIESIKAAASGVAVVLGGGSLQSTFSSSSTADAAEQYSGMQYAEGYGLPGSTLNLDDFNNTMSNPIFRGRAMLDWISRQSCSGQSMASAASSAAGASASAAVYTATVPLPGAAASAALQQHSPYAHGDSITTGSSAISNNNTHVTSAAASAGAKAQVCTSALALSADKVHSTGSSSSSLPSNVSHSLNSTGFSTDSDGLIEFVGESVTHIHFVITTESAPNTDHFQGKHIREAAAAAAARAAAAKARAAGADAAALAAAAAAAAAAAQAAATSAPPTISEDDEDCDIEFSEDGQAPDYDTATEAAIKAAIGQGQEQQQQQQRPGCLRATERLPGDFIYEMMPGVDDAICWTNPSSFTASLSSSTYSRSGGGADTSSAAGKLAMPHWDSQAHAEGGHASASLGADNTSSRAWLYATGGFFAGLARGTFGFMGTIGSLRSTAASSLASTAAQDPGSTAGQLTSNSVGCQQGVDDDQLVQDMAKAQVSRGWHCLARHHGLTSGLKIMLCVH